MNDKPNLTRQEAIVQVLAQLDGPIELDELCRQVLAIWPSTAKNALTALRSYIRKNQAGRSVVLIDPQTALPIDVAMKGVRFRIPLGRQEAERGVLIISPAFDNFWPRGLNPESVRLLDDRGQQLPVRLTVVREQVESMFGRRVSEHPAFDVGQWFRARGVRRKDSILVTIEDWSKGHFRLEHEPAKRRRREECDRLDRELADRLFDMLEQSPNETIYCSEAIPTVYARMSNPRGYPGSHWVDVVQRDPRMRCDGWAIHYADWRAPIERMVLKDEPIRQVAFSPQEGRRVYRFKAKLARRPGLWREIEIQGEQTLEDFDHILRDSFQHDSFDHLSGFWKRVRRGQGKRFRRIDVGTLRPFGGGSGADVTVAGLGLEPGQELEYVYDFGDWIEHRMTLKEIVDPEPGETYPRVVAQNKPRYRNCESCQAQGRERLATWVCVECSSEQQREVLLCRDCLSLDHEDHYVEEILY